MSDCGAANRVGLKNTGFSLYLAVSRFNCRRLIVKLLKIGISVFLYAVAYFLSKVPYIFFCLVLLKFISY